MDVEWNEEYELNKPLREAVENTGVIDHLVNMAESTGMNNMELGTVVNMDDKRHSVNLQIAASEEMDFYFFYIRDGRRQKCLTSFGKIYK